MENVKNKKIADLKAEESEMAVCKCKRPIVEKCLITGTKFCIKCISPMKTN